MFAFIKQHIIRTLVVVIGGLMAVAGAIRDIWETATLGLPNEVWLAAGLVVFFTATFSLIYKLWQRLEQPSGAGLEDKAELRLLFREGENDPERISHVNIWRWYWLRNIFMRIDKETGKKQEHVIPNLFIVFDKPMRIGSLTLNSPDFDLPRHEVKEFRERFAIIAFNDVPSPGVLEITIR